MGVKKTFQNLLVISILQFTENIASTEIESTR